MRRGHAAGEVDVTPRDRALLRIAVTFATTWLALAAGWALALLGEAGWGALCLLAGLAALRLYEHYLAELEDEDRRVRRDRRGGWW